MGEFHDVIMIGAGSGGSTTAGLLAQRGLDVLLLDKVRFSQKTRHCGDALSPRALQVAAKLGLSTDLHQADDRVDGLTAARPSGEQGALAIPQQDNYPLYGMVIRRIHLDDLIR